jgi:hypothetical protein
MSEQPGERDFMERENAAFHEGEVRKGIEIVTSQDMPSDWTPPTMGLGGSPPVSDEQQTGSDE